MIHFQVLDPIDDERREVFKLVVTHEHGDADISTDTTTYVSYTDSWFAVAVEALHRLCRDDNFPPRWEPRQHTDALKALMSHDDYERFADLFLVRDRVYDGSGSYAAVVDFKITYFNSQGVECAVKYERVGENE